MDPLSVGAGIIAVVQVADRIVELCRFYIGAVDDYPKDLRSILIETSTLKALFENIKFLIDSDGGSSPMLKSLGGEEGPIAGCQRTVSELELMFPASSAKTTRNSKRKGVKMTLAQLAWPFRQEKARALLSQLVQHKTTISTAISSETLRDVKEIKRDLGAVCRMLSYSETSDVCTWLEHTNPSDIHNKAIADYEQGTGDWITRTPEWTNWMNSTKRCLWVHGIPGAGKTVLASYAIRKVIRSLKESGDASSICAYYYCHHAHNQDEAAPFLRWIVSQLCRAAKRVPEPLYETYRLRRLPGIDALLEHLGSVLEHFSAVSVVIDALDESQSRETLLRVIHNILGDERFIKIRLLVTSREYADIEREMLSIATPLSMSNSFVEEDIRRVIAASLRSNSVFQQWPEAFRAEVEGALSSGAKGMFRWAVCQLDILRRLKHQNKVRRAIRNLPETLDEAYERIFSCIAPEDVDIVRHCLWWAMFHNAVWDSIMPLTTRVLIDTFYLKAGNELAEDEPLISGPEILKESCGCLLSFQAGDRNGGFYVSLAHYTVREYLESSRSRTGQSSLFTRSGNSSYDGEATTVFRPLPKLEEQVGEEEWEKPLESGDVGTVTAVNTSLYRLLTGLRVVYMSEITVRPSLIFEFLDPREPHFNHLVKSALNLFEGPDYGDLVGGFYSLRLTYSDNHTGAALIMARLLWLNRLDLAFQLLRSPGSARIWQQELTGNIFLDWWTGANGCWFTLSGNIFEVCATGYTSQNPDALGFLLDHGLGHFDPTSVLIHFVGTHQHRLDETCPQDCGLRRLLQLGADPNARGYPCTPLQIAAVHRDRHGIQALLQAGADPSSTGSDEEKNWEKGTVLGEFSDLRGVKPVDILRTRDYRGVDCFNGEVDDDENLSQLLMGST